MAYNRIQELLLQGQGYDFAGNSAQVNAGYGGQFGWSPNVANLQSSQAHVRRNLIPKVISVPNFFRSMPNPEVWTRTYIEIMERRAIKITGLNATITVATDSTKHGGGGYKQEEITNVTREDIDLSLELADSYGASTSLFWEQYIRYGMMDPETKFALVGVTENYPTDMLLDQYCGTMMFIEPDATHRTVIRAWLVAGIFPKGTGSIIGARDITNDMEIQKLEIKFAGVPQIGLGVNHYAQEILDSIRMEYADPNLSPAFIKGWKQDGVGIGDAEVQSIKGSGYVDGLEDTGLKNIYKDKFFTGGAGQNSTFNTGQTVA